MNISIFADNYVHYENDYLNLLSLVYFDVFKCKRSEFIPKTFNLKKRIIFLNLKDKKLKSLDLSGLHFLKILDCGFNNLESLNLIECPQLKKLDCSSNKLQNLNLKYNTQLEVLRCYFNRLESLDLSLNSQLKILIHN